MQTDVVIVGAGFAGLAAARELVRQGVSVAVLEASDRAGGGTETACADALGAVDLGGQFFNRDMTGLVGLARAHGFEIAERPSAGEGMALLGGERLPMEGFDPFDLLLQGSAEALHAKSVRQVIDEAALPSARRAVALSSMAELLSADLSRVGAQSLAMQARRYDSDWPEDEWFLPAGLGALAQAMAKDLGSRIVFQSTVSRIERHAGGVTVATERGAVVRARYCLLAMSPVVARHLAVHPPLPQAERDALASYEAGAAIKLVVGYPCRFWADDGWSGAVVFDEPHATSTLDASTAAQARLVMFIGGTTALAAAPWSPDRLKAWGLQALEAAFGAQARHPVAIAERRWLPNARLAGGYVARVVPEGRPDAAKVLRSAAPMLRFASSELALRFPGFVEGAVDAGVEAARAIARDMAAG